MTENRTIPPIHPGVLLKDEFLVPLGISAYRLAKDIDVPEQRIGAIIRGKRRITADTALRLSRYFGMSENYWTNVQAHYDLEVAKDKDGADISRIRPLAVA